MPSLHHLGARSHVTRLEAAAFNLEFELGFLAPGPDQIDAAPCCYSHLILEEVDSLPSIGARFCLQDSLLVERHFVPKDNGVANAAGGDGQCKGAVLRETDVLAVRRVEVKTEYRRGWCKVREREVPQNGGLGSVGAEGREVRQVEAAHVV
jgi:hypothetical protein